ncbi:hypothetical protein SOVF_138460, partial [Spinacia oleracea]
PSSTHQGFTIKINQSRITTRFERPRSLSKWSCRSHIVAVRQLKSVVFVLSSFVISAMVCNPFNRVAYLLERYDFGP